MVNAVDVYKRQVMMRGPKNYAIALRLPDGSIETTVHPNKSLKDRVRILKLPVLRGMVGLIESLVLGYKTLTYSFEKAGFEEEEPTKFELDVYKRQTPSRWDVSW